MLTLAAVRPVVPLVGIATFLSACAVGPAPSAASLAHVAAARSDDVAIAAAPGPAEPSAASYQRVRRRKYPRGKVLASFGVLDFEHRDFNSAGQVQLDDVTTARVFRLEAESVRRTVGGGASVQLITVNDDLHNNTAGITSSDTTVLDLFAHVTVRPVARRFRTPIRIGPYFSVLDQETEGASPDDIEYFSFGLRAEVEPEFDIVRTRNTAVSLFVNGNAHAGVTAIDYRTQAFDEDFETSSWGVGLRAGVRMSIRRMHFQAAYVYSRRTYEESDEEFVNGSFQTLNEAEFMQDGFMLSMGIRW